MTLKGRNLLKMMDFTPEEILYLVDLSAELKEKKHQGIMHDSLVGKNIALIFEKTSTRTRCSFEVAAHDLGMHVTYLDPSGSQIGKKESIPDTARVLGRMFDGIEYRGYGQEIVEELAKYAGVPVWNGSVSAKTWTFLILSGLATGASWLCYFRALQIGDVDKVVSVDKSSAILSILLAFLFLHESISPLKLLCVVLIGAGTYLMITKKGTSSENSGKKGWSWFFYALGSAVFASLTSILGKVGIEDIDSNLGTAIRTIVVLIMAWIVVFVTKKQDSVRTIDHRELGFICLSGLATGASWLCYYRALQDGLASVVVPIDKLSILVTILFSYLVFHEKLGKKEAGGLVLIVVGTLGMLV